MDGSLHSVMKMFSRISEEHPSGLDLISAVYFLLASQHSTVHHGGGGGLVGGATADETADESVSDDFGSGEMSFPPEALCSQTLRVSSSACCNQQLLLPA